MVNFETPRGVNKNPLIADSDSSSLIERTGYPPRERIHIPPNGKFGTSSTQNPIFFGGICVFSLVRVPFSWFWVHQSRSENLIVKLQPWWWWNLPWMSYPILFNSPDVEDGASSLGGKNRFPGVTPWGAGDFFLTICSSQKHLPQQKVPIPPKYFYMR